MKAQNADAGKDIFDAADIAACIAWSDRIILEIEARRSTALVGSDITAATLPRNATIGFNIGDFGWEANFPRTRGINHIVQVVHRPSDQTSFVSESIGPDDKSGVRLTPLGSATATALSQLAKHGRSTRSPRPTATRYDFRSWHIASFRCGAEFGRYRAIADIAQAAPINLDL